MAKQAPDAPPAGEGSSEEGACADRRGGNA